MKENDVLLLNRFILFYTLRFLWKENKHPVDELYAILFKSKRKGGGNKTLYDNILGMKDIELTGKAKQLSQITGLNEAYFTGRHRLSVGIDEQIWQEFAILRKKPTGGTKTAELTTIEREIKEKIRGAVKVTANQSESFRRLLYFAQYKQKRTDKTTEDLFNEISEKIDKCFPGALEQVSMDKLEKYYKLLLEHTNRVAAVVEVRRWKSSLEDSKN